MNLKAFLKKELAPLRIKNATLAKILEGMMKEEFSMLSSLLFRIENNA
ncbi:hypothetical protein ABEW19_12445 [Paenibacillus illinoisensis]